MITRFEECGEDERIANTLEIVVGMYFNNGLLLFMEKDQ